MFGDILTGSEVEFCDRVRNELSDVEWVQSLLAKLPPTKQLSKKDKPLLFELRFAHEIHRRGLTARYEASCGVGSSTVDFALVVNGVTWCIELVSLRTSEALRAASWENGIFFGVQLSSNAADPRQSHEGEMLLVQQKVAEKVWRENGPTKFPLPTANTFHVIVVDLRAFTITSDVYDYRELAYGHPGLPPDSAHLAHYWPPVKGSPILGLFDPTNTKLRGAGTVRERIHALGFANNETYEAGRLAQETHYLGNPLLLGRRVGRAPRSLPAASSRGDQPRPLGWMNGGTHFGTRHLRRTVLPVPSLFLGLWFGLLRSSLVCQ